MLFGIFIHCVFCVCANSGNESASVFMFNIISVVFFFNTAAVCWRLKNSVIVMGITSDAQNNNKVKQQQIKKTTKYSSAKGNVWRVYVRSK